MYRWTIGLSLTLFALMMGACTPVSAPEQPTIDGTASATPGAAQAVDASPAPAKASAETDMNGPKADVLFVRAVQAEDGAWTFAVAVQHPDTGWENYADGWDVVTPDGEVLRPDPDSPFTRLLLHPHVDEQPFTRSQSNIVVPEGVARVRVRAHSLIGGFGGREIEIDLVDGVGADYEIEAQDGAAGVD